MSTDEGMKHVFVMAAVEESPYWDAATEEAAEARWDSWLAAHDAQVRRDAARAALDGLAEQEVEHALSYSARDDHDRYRQCEHAWQAVNDYRHTRYPEETP